jgi:hypothetical protein
MGEDLAGPLALLMPLWMLKLVPPFYAGERGWHNGGSGRGIDPAKARAGFGGKSFRGRTA